MRKLFAFSWFLLIIALVVGYSLYLDTAGLLASGSVYAKREIVSVHFSNWNRSQYVTVQFRPPGEASPWFADGRIDAATYDRLHVGDPMQVRYLASPILHQVRLIPDTRLATDTTFSMPRDVYLPLLQVIGVVLLLFLLLFLAARTRSRLLAVPFLILGALAFGYFIFPRQTPAPGGVTASGRATVLHLSPITRIFEGRHSRGLGMSQPFDIVQLSFTPQGFSGPVVGVDEIDHDSIPGLSSGDILPIEYQADRPRIVRILAGERTFPEKSRLDYLVTTGAMLLVLFIAHWIHMTLRSKSVRLAGKAQAAILDPRQQAMREAILNRKQAASKSSK